MVGVDKNDLVVLVDAVLVDPVGVEDTEVTAPPANTLLGDTPQTTLGLELGDTLTNGLAVGGTCKGLRYMLLNANGGTYPWGRASCGYRDGHGRGR